MPASFPSSAKTFTTKSDGAGNTILAAHINDLQLEVTAIESSLLGSTAFTMALTGSFSATGDMGVAALSKFYFDGIAMTGDTYILESAANVLSLFSGGVEAKLTSGVLTLGVAGTHTITGAANSAQTLAITNTTSGTAGKVEELQTAGTAVGRLSTFSQGFTTSGLSILSTTLLEAQAAGGLSIAASNAAGAIRFYSGGTTERGRFNSGGQFSLGTSSEVGGAASMRILHDPAAIYGIVIMSSNDTATGRAMRFYNAAGTEQGSIQYTNSTTTGYVTSSDARMKRDKGLSTDLSGLRAIRVHDFDWIGSGLSARGVFAQEAHAVMPAVVSVGSDERTTDGHLMTPWGVDYSKFVPDLIVGWQHLEARIVALEAARG